MSDKSDEAFTQPPNTAKMATMTERTPDALLAERLMQLKASKVFVGRYRTSDQYVNSEHVAEVLAGAVGYRTVIEFCIAVLEDRYEEI